MRQVDPRLAPTARVVEQLLHIRLSAGCGKRRACRIRERSDVVFVEADRLLQGVVRTQQTPVAAFCVAFRGFVNDEDTERVLHQVIGIGAVIVVGVVCVQEVVEIEDRLVAFGVTGQAERVAHDRSLRPAGEVVVADAPGLQVVLIARGGARPFISEIEAAACG